MSKQTAALAILGLAFLNAACDDTELRIAAAAPAPLQSGASTTFARVEPSSITAQPIGVGLCPRVQPLRATMNLVVFADDDTTLLLTEVRLQFVDAFGVAAPQVTLTAPVLTTQFGTALVNARSSRSFPLDLLFGCGTDRRGTIVVIVDTRDGHGRHRSTEVRVGVR